MTDHVRDLNDDARPVEEASAEAAIDQMEALVLEAINQHTLPLSVGHGARAIDIEGLQGAIGRIARNLKREPRTLGRE